MYDLAPDEGLIDQLQSLDELGDSPRTRQRADIITLLSDEWNKHPELRFGQRVENFIRPPWQDQAKEQEHWKHCIFNTTDEQALARLKEGLPR